MDFILSPEIVKDIIFAMENQAHISLFDTERGICVPVPEDFDEFSDCSVIRRFYPIPEWKPAQGFRLMELFTAKVRNPLIKEALQGALKERKGVFRRFKKILKTQPEIESQWFQFKESAMQGLVFEWYNELRQCWGLERVSFDEEELSPIIRQDFSFEHIRGYENIACLLKQFEEISGQNSSVLAGSSGSTAAPAEQQCSMYINLIAAQFRQQMFVSDFLAETAVCITASTDGYGSVCGFCVLLPAHDSKAAVIPALYVLPDYRGMGIGKELLNQAVHYARNDSSTPVIFAELSIPDYFHAFLERNGFTRTGLLYTIY